jgi:hypothetical protein
MTPETALDALMSVAIGLGLAAACGFRVFVPLLAVALAGRSGYLPLSPELEWVATTPAIIAFATATVLEVVAYQVPWLDHALDSLATPAALAGGIIACASVMTELPPLLRWSVRRRRRRGRRRSGSDRACATQIRRAHRRSR